MSELTVDDYDLAISEKAPANNYGGKNINASYKGGVTPKFRLFEGASCERLTVPFGFQARDEERGYPKIYLNLDGSRLDFADKLDEHVKKVATAKSRDFFGTPKPPTYYPLVAKPDGFPERMRVNIDVSVANDHSTRFDYKPLDGEIQGELSLAEIREKTAGKPVSAHAVLRFRGIWTRKVGSEKSYGAQLYACKLTVCEEGAPSREDEDFDFGELAPKRRRTE